MELTEGILWLGSIVALLYIGGPITVKLSFRYRTTQAPAVADADSLPREVRGYFDRIETSLLELGFHHVVYLLAEGQVARLHTYIACYTHPTQGRMAGAMIIYGGIQPNCSVECETVSGDGMIVDTSNAKHVSTFSAVPNKKMLYAPAIDDLALLYRLHTAREAKHIPPTADRFLPTPGTEADLCALITALDLWWQTEAGYFRRSTKPGVYVPTWTGAAMMTWKQIFPVHQILRWLQARKVRHALHEAMERPLTSLTPVRITHRIPFHISEGFPVILPQGCGATAT